LRFYRASFRISDFGFPVSGPWLLAQRFGFRASDAVFKDEGFGFGFRDSGSRCRFSGCRLRTRDSSSRFTDPGLGFGFRVSGFGFQVSGFGYRVSGSGFRASGFGCRVSGSGFRVRGFGFRVPGWIGSTRGPGPSHTRRPCGTPGSVFRVCDSGFRD